MKNKLVRKMVLCSLLAAILFVQEEVLSFIPSVQFTFLLIIIYGATLGLKWGTLIVLVHVILDNAIMGTLTPLIMVPMFIGLEFTLILGVLSKKCPLWLICIIGGISAIIYALCFAITNVLFQDIDLVAYLIADIPFTGIMICSNVFALMWLYRPLVKVINERILEKRVPINIDVVDNTNSNTDSNTNSNNINIEKNESKDKE